MYNEKDIKSFEYIVFLYNNDTLLRHQTVVKET